MNGKKAKQLRRKAHLLEQAFIADRVLTEEQIQEATPEQLHNVMPKRLLIRKDNRLEQAIGTKRWFNRQVKKSPDITYRELMDAYI